MAEETSGWTVKGEKKLSRQTKGEKVLQAQVEASEKTWQLQSVGLTWTFHSSF